MRIPNKMCFDILRKRKGLKILIRCPKIFDKYLGHLIDLNGNYFIDDYNSYVKKYFLKESVRANIEIEPIDTDLPYSLNQIVDPTKNINGISELSSKLKVSIESDCGNCIHRFNFEMTGGCEEVFNAQILEG